MTAHCLPIMPKLKGRENYDDWAFAAENYLLVDGIDINDFNNDGSIEDKKARAKLIMTIDPSLYTHIKNEKTVRGLWNKLKTLFVDSGVICKVNLLRKLVGIRLGSYKDMTTYVGELVETADKLRKIGVEVNDQWMSLLLLAGLPDRYDYMLMAIAHLGMEGNSDAIKAKLLDLSVDVGKIEGQFSNDNTALVKGRDGDKGKGNNPHNEKLRVSGVKKGKCYKCRQVSRHTSRK